MKQRKFWNWLIEQNCKICGNYPEIHHVVGASARKNKIKIGHYYVLPLCYFHHRDPQNPQNVNDWPKRFEVQYGTQLNLFNDLVKEYESQKFKFPFDQEIHEAIKEA